jgi:hypothetical protein
MSGVEWGIIKRADKGHHSFVQEGSIFISQSLSCPSSLNRWGAEAATSSVLACHWLPLPGLEMTSQKAGANTGINQ